MKDFKAMTQEEALTYAATLQAWINKEYSIISLPGVVWSARDRVSMERGLELISAFRFARDFARSSLLFKDYARRIARMKVYLDKIMEELANENIDVTALSKRRRGRPTREESERRKREEEAVAIANGAESGTDSSKSEKEKNIIPDTFTAAALSGDGTRLHLDQLAWLMSPDLRVAIGKIAELRGISASESNQAKELALHDVTSDVIAPHTKAAIEADKQVLEIYASVDHELGDLYAALFVQHLEPVTSTMKAHVEEVGITLDLLGRILKPYWTKIGSPEVSCATPTLLSDKEKKEDHRAELHKIRTYFFRKDTSLSEARVQKMRDMIKTLENYGVATDEYLVVLNKSEKELADLQSEQSEQSNDSNDLFDNVTEQEE